MKAVLFPNLVEFPSLSMKRYATELTAALRQAAGPEWEIEAKVCHQNALAARIPGPAGRTLAGRLARQVTYPWMAARARGDVFHILDHSHANLTAALPPAKTVLSCHDLIPLLAARGEIALPISRWKRATFPLYLRCIRRAAQILTISEATRRDLIRFGNIPPERIHVTYLGISRAFTACPLPGETTETERDGIRAAQGLPPDAKIVLHVGTRNRYKNTPALLHALSALNSRPALHGKVYLLRVGADLFPDEWALAESLGVAERVVFVGRVPGDDRLAAVYRAADVFAFPSLWEGFGWPPVEAMACGTPVVASDAAALPEAVGEAGLLVSPQDVSGLAAALERVLTDADLRAALRARGLAHARQFTWERCAAQTLAVYEKVAGLQSGERS